VLQVRLALLVLLVLLVRLVLQVQVQVALVPLALLALARAGLLVVRGVACHFPPYFFSFPNDELMG